MKHTTLFLAVAACLYAVALPVASRASWVPFRFAISDSYESVEEWEAESSSVYGLRIGLFESVNRDVYGLSLTVGFDGGTGLGQPNALGGYRRACVDDNFSGLKIGGFASAASGTGAGFQIAGVRNRTDVEFSGFQIAGLWNETAFLYGVQLSGAYCESTTEMGGLQLAGLYSHCGTRDPEMSESWGFQFGGLAAICDGAFSGLQIAALYNEAHVLHGLQIGLVNYARSLDGVQIGLVNVSGCRANGDLQGFPVLNASF